MYGRWVISDFKVATSRSRYGETKHCRDGSDRVFSKLWVKNCAERVLDAHLALVGQIAEVRCCLSALNPSSHVSRSLQPFEVIFYLYSCLCSTHARITTRCSPVEAFISRVV